MDYKVRAVPLWRLCASAASHAGSIEKQSSQYQCTFAVVCKLLGGLKPLKAFVLLFFFVLIKCKLLRKVTEEVPR